MSVVNLSLCFIYLFVAFPYCVAADCRLTQITVFEKSDNVEWWNVFHLNCCIKLSVSVQVSKEPEVWLNWFICLQLFWQLLLWYTVSMLCRCMLYSIFLRNFKVITCFQLPAQMGSLLGSALALHYLDCVQDESASLRLNFWLGHSLQEGTFSMS